MITKTKFAIFSLLATKAYYVTPASAEVRFTAACVVFAALAGLTAYAQYAFFEDDDESCVDRDMRYQAVTDVARDARSMDNDLDAESNSGSDD
jgi:hypothetical protein